MTITCNGKSMTVRDGISLEELIMELELNPDTVVAECAGQIVRRNDYSRRILGEGEKVELIRFVGGG